MTQAQETGKRMVSKIGMSESGLLLLLFCTIGFLITLVLLFFDLRVMLAAVFFVTFFLASLLSTKLIAKEMGDDVLLPLTRANTAALPAPDSLVRTSHEPVQAQEGVLLHAATGETQTPPEQLLRAAE